MNRQVLSMLTSTHELVDGMEKGILLSSQANMQIYFNAAFTNLHSKDLPFLFSLDTIIALKVHIPHSDGTLLINDISKGFRATKSCSKEKE